MIKDGINGYEMTGSWTHGTFYLRKAFTIRQHLAFTISRTQAAWLQQGEFETSADFSARSTQPSKDEFANITTTGFFQNVIGTENLKITYDVTLQQFSVDPLIGDPFILKVPTQQAACFKTQFLKWSADSLHFSWDHSTRKATPLAFVIKYTCKKQQFKLSYP
jgi:hypothetical protein